jgi:hypothetical protein
MNSPNVQYCPTASALVDHQVNWGAVPIDDLKRYPSADVSESARNPNLDPSFTSRCVLHEVFALFDGKGVTITVIDPNRRAPVRGAIAVANLREQGQVFDFLRRRIGEGMDSVLIDLRKWREAL